MAEFIFKDVVSGRNLADRFYIAFAATSTEEIWDGTGNPVYPPAWEELAKHGISCKGKRAVQLKKEDYEKYDYILGMDPWYTGRFDVTYADVVEGCEAFLDYLEKMKKLDEEHVEKRVAFEVSVSKLELLEEAQVQESIV